MWFAAAILGIIAIGFGVTKLPANPEVPPAQASTAAGPTSTAPAPPPGGTAPSP